MIVYTDLRVIARGWLADDSATIRSKWDAVLIDNRLRGLISGCGDADSSRRSLSKLCTPKWSSLHGRLGAVLSMTSMARVSNREAPPLVLVTLYRVAKFFALELISLWSFVSQTCGFASFKLIALTGALNLAIPAELHMMFGYFLSRGKIVRLRVR